MTGSGVWLGAADGRGQRSSMSSAFRLDIVTDRPPYAAVNHRWPSFSSRRPSYLEQSTAARHVSTVTGHLSQSPQDSTLQALLSMTSLFSSRAREVTCHYGHVNRFYYLLTWLGLNDLPSAWRRPNGRALDYNDRAALLLMSLWTAASKERLIKRHIILRFSDAAFPRLYCLKFSCK